MQSEGLGYCIMNRPSYSYTYIVGLQKSMAWFKTMDDGRSIIVFLLYILAWLSQGRMTNFPVFIASKSFDLINHHIPKIK
jgi:hypothetical protein